MRRLTATVLIVLGAVFLSGALVAGVVNREVLDGPRFAAHVDTIRMSTSVSAQVGQAITDQVLAIDPDLVAVRPLVETIATAVVRSPRFSTLVQASVRQLHDAFTKPESGQIVLRLADLGAVLVGALHAVAPQAAARLPANLDVTLARIGKQSFAARTIAMARNARWAAISLPILAVLCFGAAVLVAPDRRRVWRRCAGAVIAAGATVGVLCGAVSLFVWTWHPRSLRAVLIQQTWHEFSRLLLRSCLLAMLAGTLLWVAVLLWQSERTVSSVWRTSLNWLVRGPDAPRALAARALLLLAASALLLIRPIVAVQVVAVVAGLWLLAMALSELAALISQWRPRWRLVNRRLAGVVAAVGVTSLVVLTFAGAQPDAPLAAAAAPTVDTASGPCNGHVQLCDRRYNDVAFPGTHNSMSAADEPGWYFAEQPTGLVGQLDAGIRVLLFDTWYGQHTQRPGVIANTNAQRAAALAEADIAYGAETVASTLRLQKLARLTPSGPVSTYLCHNVCEFGSTPLLSEMVQVRDWIANHPREVVTFFIQDQVSPAGTAAVFRQAGLVDYVHTQQLGQPWPTLGQLISSGQRLVVLMEDHGGGSAYPWLLQGFEWVQDTPYDFPSSAAFSCARLRGTTQSPLFLVNHWLSRFRSRVSDSNAVNAFDTLYPRLLQCESERGMIPNFVAVNFYDHGGLFEAVNRLNGIP